MKHKPVLNNKQLEGVTIPTPFFCFSEEQIKQNYNRFLKLFPDADIFYAMKANSERPLLNVLDALGSGFEISSSYELELLIGLGINPKRVIFGNPVKSIAEIKAAFEKNVRFFSVDSFDEIDKLAQFAPGSSVYVRALVEDTESVFTLSEKFGAPIEDIPAMLIKCKEKDLKPWGITFHVGSQAKNANSWYKAIVGFKPVLDELLSQNLRLEILNIGGGYPFTYQDDDQMPELKEIAELTERALKELPYQPKVIVEPGRGLSVNCMVLVTSVIANLKRPSGNWLYLDAGAYNALLEAMIFQGSTRYAITTLGEHSSQLLDQFTLTGPTCDSLDTIAKDIWLPADIKMGDRLIVHDVGAYSTVLITEFNGFPKPPIYVV